MSRKSTDENVLRIFISVRNIQFLKEDNHKVLVLTLMNFPHQRLSTSDKSLKVSIFVIRWICLYINIDVMLLMWKKIKGLSFRIPINTLYLLSCSSYNSYNRNLSYRIIIWLRKIMNGQNIMTWYFWVIYLLCCPLIFHSKHNFIFRSKRIVYIAKMKYNLAT